MSSFHRIFTVSAAVAVSAMSMFAQNVISAKSGLVHYIEGDVSVDGKPVSDKPGVFADIKKGGELATTLGRAEVLLTPGVFLRVAENSNVVMRDNSLADTKVELVSGNAMVESDTPMKDNKVTVLYKDYAVTFQKYGLYGFQSQPAQLRVYKGEAEVTAGGQTVVVHEGHQMAFTAALAQEKFDVKSGDSLYRWSKLRSEYISVANVSAAKSAGSYGSGFGTSGFTGMGLGNWYYNSFYGMYTYLPYAGTYFSPFGYGYYSPGTVGQFYNNYYYYGGGGGLPSGTTVKNSTNSNVLTSNNVSSGVSKGGSGVGLVGGGSGHVGGAGGSGGGAAHH